MTPKIELSVERTFAAAHAIRLGGEQEPLHGHHWHVTVTVEGEALDAEGLLCDFHALEQIVDEAIRPWHNHNLNEVEPFAGGVNPTAELVCQELARRVAQGIQGKLGAAIRLAAVRLTEAPGCAVTLRFALA